MPSARSLANLRPVKPGESSPALRHGGRSEVQIRPRAAAHKRRLLRQIGLRAGDLDALGRGLLTNWARAAAALQLMDEYAAAHGWLDEQGEPRGFARLYVSLLNAERLALRALDGYVRDRGIEPSMVAVLQGKATRVS